MRVSEPKMRTMTAVTSGITGMRFSIAYDTPRVTNTHAISTAVAAKMPSRE
jgi:hypothetical protein